MMFSYMPTLPMTRVLLKQWRSCNFSCLFHNNFYTQIIMEQTRKSAVVSRVCFSLTHPTHDWFKLHAGNFKTVYISCRTLRYCHFASLFLFVDTLIAKKDKKKVENVTYVLKQTAFEYYFFARYANIWC